MRGEAEIRAELERARATSEAAMQTTQRNLFGLGMLQGYLRALQWVMGVDEGKENVLDEYGR